MYKIEYTYTKVEKKGTAIIYTTHTTTSYREASAPGTKIKNITIIKL